MIPVPVSCALLMRMRLFFSRGKKKALKMTLNRFNDPDSE